MGTNENFVLEIISQQHMYELVFKGCRMKLFIWNKFRTPTYCYYSIFILKKSLI